MRRLVAECRVSGNLSFSRFNDTSRRGFSLMAALSFLAVPILDTVPILKNHTLYLVTPSATAGDSLTVALDDLLNLSSFIVGAPSVSPSGHKHVHYLASIPNHLTSFLDSYIKNGYFRIVGRGRYRKKLPLVSYFKNDDVCEMSFSKITDLDGVLAYLDGPKNNAKFVTILDARGSCGSGYYNNNSSIRNISNRISQISNNSTLHNKYYLSVLERYFLDNQPSLLLDTLYNEPCKSDTLQGLDLAREWSKVALFIDGKKKIANKKLHVLKQAIRQQAFKLVTYLALLVTQKKETSPKSAIYIFGYI